MKNNDIFFSPSDSLVSVEIRDVVNMTVPFITFLYHQGNGYRLANTKSSNIYFVALHLYIFLKNKVEVN